MYTVRTQLTTACLCMTGLDSRGDQRPAVTGGPYRPGNPARFHGACARHSGPKSSHPSDGSRWGHMPRVRGQWCWPDAGLENKWVLLEPDVKRPSTLSIRITPFFWRLDSCKNFGVRKSVWSADAVTHCPRVKASRHWFIWDLEVIFHTFKYFTLDGGKKLFTVSGGFSPQKKTQSC